MSRINRFQSLTALLLGVPFTSIGAIFLLLLFPGLAGKTVLIICQIWLLILPIIWLVKIEQKSIEISPPKRFDWIAGIIIGLLMFGIILAVYWLLLRQWIDVDFVRAKLKQVGNLDRQAFVFGGAYFILINALIEEYFWRWFIYSRCEDLVSSKIAVFLSAVFFTLHHTIGLIVFTNLRVTLVGTIAVFVAGVLWSEYYRRYRSIWGNYFSHAIADLALHIVAWQVFFE